jgi:hypothetical protein
MGDSPYGLYNVPVIRTANYHTDLTAALAALEAGIENAPQARVYHNAAQSVANATLAALAFNSERFDTDTIHDNATNNSRLTCKTAGLYLITGSLAFNTAATGNVRAAQIRINGATDIAAQYIPPIGGGALATIISVATLYVMAVNDYAQLMVYQDSGGALNVNAAGNYSPEFAMVKVG